MTKNQYFEQKLNAMTNMKINNLMDLLNDNLQNKQKSTIL